MNKLTDLQIIIFQIIKNNPQKPWDYKFLSQGPNITWDNVIDNPDLPRDYNFLSQGPNITYQIIQNNNKHWNYYQLSKNIFNNRKYNWSKKLHKFYSKQIKAEILHLLWIWKKGENIKCLPKDVLYMILEIIY